MEVGEWGMFGVQCLEVGHGTIRWRCWSRCLYNIYQQAYKRVFQVTIGMSVLLQVLNEASLL